MEWIGKPENMELLSRVIHKMAKKLNKSGAACRFTHAEKKGAAERFLINYASYYDLPCVDRSIYGAVLQQVKWALTNQSDTYLVKSHPTGLKYKAIYRYELRKLGIEVE